MKNVVLRARRAGLTLCLFALLGCEPKPTTPDAGAGPTYECQICTCRTDSPVRPMKIYGMVDALIAAVQGKGDPGTSYVGVMPNHQSSFWDVPAIGFNKAKAEIGCLGDFHFPPSNTEPLDVIIQAQVDAMADWSAEGGTLPKASGVALSCKSDQRLRDPINQALDAGVNTITFDSDSIASDRLLYMGTLNLPAGRTAGGKMLELLAGSATAKVLVLAGFQTEANTRDRVTGIEQVFAEAGRPAALDVRWGSFDATLPAALDAALQSYGTNLNGIIALSGTFGPIAADWVKGKALTGQVKIVGWDTSTGLMAHLDSGVVHATVAQKSYFFGYLPVYILYSMKALGVQETRTVLTPFLSGPKQDILDTGVDLITPSNVGEYRAYQKDCLGVISG